MVRNLGWTFPGSRAVSQSQFTLTEWRLERLCESVSDGDTPEFVARWKIRNVAQVRRVSSRVTGLEGIAVGGAAPLHE
jgi:hypothetical protein